MGENATREVLSAVSSSYDNVKRYYTENCKTYTIRMPKADARALDEYAAAHGCSVQALFLTAVADYMTQGKAPSAVKRGRKPKDTVE